MDINVFLSEGVSYLSCERQESYLR